VRQGSLLATAFHPELTGDRRIHQLFVTMVRERVTTDTARVTSSQDFEGTKKR
jgi:5'-phosphate synthase pdxT subunit